MLLLFFVKIFGNELKFTILDGDKQVMTALADFNPWQKIKEFMAMREILYERAGMFLDSSYVVPMGSGLPIRLDFAGSAACNLKISKTMNDARLSDREFQLTGNIASRSVFFLILSKIPIIITFFSSNYRFILYYSSCSNQYYFLNYLIVSLFSYFPFTV